MAVCDKSITSCPLSIMAVFSCSVSTNLPLSERPMARSAYACDAHLKTIMPSMVPRKATKRSFPPFGSMYTSDAAAIRALLATTSLMALICAGDPSTPMPA